MASDSPADNRKQSVNDYSNIIKYQGFRRATVYTKEWKRNEIREIGSLRNMLPAKSQANYNKSIDLYYQLQDYVGNIEKKLEGVVERNENDFLIAYRSSMTAIQKQLQNLKLKSDEAESQMKIDTKVKDLTKALEWFEKESLKLADTVTKQKKEMLDFKVAIDNVRTENEFLTKQIKKSKAKYKKFKEIMDQAKEIIEKSQPSITDNLAINMLNSLRNLILEQNSQQDKALTPEISRKPSQAVAYSTRDLKKRQNSALISNVPKSSLTESQIQSLIKEYIVSSNQKTGGSINSLNEKLAQKQKEIIKLKAMLNEEKTNKGKYEELFIECIKTIKQDGAIKDITSTEKRRVIELLISNEEFITSVYNALFGEKHQQEISSLFTYEKGKKRPQPPFTPIDKKTANYRIKKGRLLLGNVNKSYH